MSQIPLANFDLSNRVKVRVTFPKEETRTSLFGENVVVGEDGYPYVDIPAHPELKQYVRDLWPSWSMSADFVDTTGLDIGAEKDEEITTVKPRKEF